MWASSMLNWYENREVQIVLPASLKEIETQTQILETPKEGKENDDQTIQY